MVVYRAFFGTAFVFAAFTLAHAAAREALRHLAPCGGFMLADGANVCPGTPVENLAELTLAAEEYGLPD